MTFGNASSEFIRRSVVPQVDAYRFATIAGTEGIGSASAALTTGDAVIKALSAGMTAMDEAEVPQEGRILYITPTHHQLVQDMETYKSKNILSRFSKIVLVPQARFYSKVDISNAGFAKNADGKNLNFLILDPKAVFAVAKHKKLKVFNPEVNQKGDDYLFQYRLYHDMFAYPQKVAGIYAHISTT
jgi:hypothetical protein